MNAPIANSLNDAEKKSRHFSVTGKPAFFVLVAWLLLGWFCLVTWQAFEHAASVQIHKDNLVRLGKANIRVLEAAIRSMGRGRREQPEFLSYVLKEIVLVPEIKGAWLKELDGTLLASTVSSEEFSLPSTESEETWLEDGLMVARNIDVSGCMIGGNRRFSNSPNESRIVRMHLFLDRVHLDREIKSDMSLRTGIVAVAAVVFAGAFLLLRIRKKSKGLKAELGLAKELVRRNKEWALLGAGLAHETKNPISVIRGFAQQLTEEDSASPSEYRKYAGRIVDEVDRIVTRIDEFLQFSRPVEPNLAPVNLHELFQEMATLIRADLSPRNGRIKIESEPVVTIQADENMLRQILLNLLVNAAYSLSYGGQIELHADLSEDISVSVEVKDNGEGIPAEEIDKIFEPYYTRSEGGTGLGLAIVRRLVEAHGWHVTINSKLGAGTSVMISGMEQVK